MSSILITIDRIRLHHPIERPAQVTSLALSMRCHGWQGRPLLVEMLDAPTRGYADAQGRSAPSSALPEFQAWTGTHRLAAASRARLARVPCVLVDVRRLRKVIQKFASDASHGAGSSGSSSTTSQFPGVPSDRRAPPCYLYSLPPQWYDEDRARFLDFIGDVAGAALLRQETQQNAADDRDQGRRRVG